jgi:hypothetical protein
MLHEQNNRLVDNASNGHLPEGSTLSLGDCFVHGGTPMPETYYRIVDWDKHFENNRSRQLQKLDWVPVPNRHDGDGYTELLDHPDGAAHLGAWLAIVQVASKCHPRGTLVREGDRPHNPASISRITRVPAEVIEAAIKRLVDIGWMEVISASTGSKTDDCHDPAPERHDPAPGCELVTKEGKGREGKGKEQNTVVRVRFSANEIEQVYQAYPRKVGKAAALKAIEKALRVIAKRGRGDPVEWLLDRVKTYAQSPDGNNGRYTPHPSRWMNESRYDDDDAEWRRCENQGSGSTDQVSRVQSPAGKYDHLEAG